jgi:hypothetical protein
MSKRKDGFEGDNTPIFRLGAAALRLQGALGGLRLPPEVAFDAAPLHEWLARMILPVEMTAAAVSAAAATKLAASLDLHSGGLTWRVSDPFPDMVLKLGAELATMAADPAQVEQFSRLTDQLQPERLTGWLRANGRTLEAGWSIEEPLDLTGLRDLSGLANQNIAHCLSLEGSFSPGNPYLGVQFPLPGTTADAQLDYALDLFDSFQLGGPPDDALAALRHYCPGKWLATIRLTAAGVSRIGIAVRRPSTKIVLRLRKIHDAGLVSAQELAAFEGALGAVGATAVESVQLSDGYGLTLHYDLP